MKYVNCLIFMHLASLEKGPMRAYMRDYIHTYIHSVCAREQSVCFQFFVPRALHSSFCMQYGGMRIMHANLHHFQHKFLG